jgi:hypothetical protein
VEVVRLRPCSLGLPFSLRVHLKEAEIVLSRPRRKISSPDPEYLVKKGGRGDARQLESGEVFYYADEFNLSWMPTLRAMWSPKGLQVMVPTPGQPTKHYGIGAVNYHTGETVVLFRRRKRRTEIAELLQVLLDKHPKETIYVA